MFYLDLKIKSVKIDDCPAAEKAMVIIHNIKQQIIDATPKETVDDNVLNLEIEGCVSDQHKIRNWLSELNTYLGETVVIIINEMRWEMTVTIRHVATRVGLTLATTLDNPGHWYPTLLPIKTRMV